MLVATPANHHIVRAVNRRSDRIRNQQLAANEAIQREEDDIFLHQQRSNSWTASLNSQVIDQMAGNNRDTATPSQTASTTTPAPPPPPTSTTPPPTTSTTQPAPPPTNTTSTMNDEEAPPWNLPPKMSQQMKDLELWHQRMGHCSTRTMN